MATPARLGGDSDATKAAEFLKEVISAVTQQSREAVAGDGPRLFFPDGIDVISLKFKVGSAVDISLTISGKTCCKTAADLEVVADAGGDLAQPGENEVVPG